MSKKYKKHQQAMTISASSSLNGAEFNIIKHDLFRVVILNAIYLAGVLTLYFTNTKSHYLEKFLGHLLHF
jgi:hypothetical protein